MTEGFTDYRAKWAKQIARDNIYNELRILNSQGIPLPPHYQLGPGQGSPNDLPLDPDLEGKAAPQAPPISHHLRLCIVGAGVAGLYIADILNQLNLPNVSYTILERENRVGGRVYTKEFSKTKHDYYDIGAMRFPDIPIMKPTFELFKDKRVPLSKYYLEGVKCPRRFNDITISADDSQTDPFQVSVSNKGSVPDDVVDKVDEILNGKKGVGGVFGPYKDALRKDWDKGYEMLKEVDEYSTREYLKRRGKSLNPPAGYDLPSIQWMETLNTSSGLFDQAFSESVFDALDFDYYPDKKVDWYCVEGGTSILTETMRKEVEQSTIGDIQLGKRVDSISLDRDADDTVNNVFVHCAGDEKPTGYATVFNTTPLGCLQRMDLTGLELDSVQKDAIRCLHYDHSVKVAIKFKTPWWRNKCGIIQGGVASTDLPLRTCVYPSYNIHDDPKSPAILLVSYTWAQDAARIAALVRNEEPVQQNVKSELLQLILYNLWRLHDKDINSVKELEDEYDSHHAFSWSDDPSATGAFALFGPGQFKQYYTHLTRPAAEGKFHMVGEASSTHHAWIVGALESALRAVALFLRSHYQWDAIRTLEEQYGTLPDVEMGVDGTAHLQVLLGEIPGEWKL